MSTLYNKSYIKIEEMYRRHGKAWKFIAASIVVKKQIEQKNPL